MKTLDKVIEAQNRCETYPNCHFCYLHSGPICEWIRDALHYLKEYRETKKHLACLDDAEIRGDNTQVVNNPPLTWEELRTMEGKPVWVEVLSDEIDLSSRWMLVARETKAHSLPLAYTDDIGHWIFGHEDKLGKTWQAFKKERG